MNTNLETIFTWDTAKFMIVYISAGLLSLLVCEVMFLFDRFLDPIYESIWGTWLIFIAVLGGLPSFLTMVLSALIRFNHCPPLSKALKPIVVGVFLSMALYLGFYIVYSPYIDETFYVPTPIVVAWSATLAALIATAWMYDLSEESNGNT